MVISDQELVFQRLLLRTRKLCRDDLAGNVCRLKKSVQRLEHVFIQLQGDQDVDPDLLMQYGRDLQQIRVIVEAENKKDVVEKLGVLDKMPKSFPALSGNELRRRTVDKHDPDWTSNSMLKTQTEAAFRADLRRQLIGLDAESEKTVEQHEEDQNYLATQLLSLTRDMKQQFSLAGEIIKEDNSRLDQMQRQTEDNKLNLDRESKVLQHHAYKSCFDCMVLLIVVLVVWSFIAMVLVMKIFPKK